MGPRLLRTSVRVALVALACALVVTCVALLAGRSDPDPRWAPPAGSETPLAARRVLEPREVLRAWDEQRSRAWIDGDADRLADLYTAGSVAGHRDVLLLRRWTARSLKVIRLQPQVLALTTVHAEPNLLVLRVTDRVGVLSADLDGQPVSLPRDEVSTRRVVLRRDPEDAESWRVAAVTGLATPASLGG